MSGPPSLFLVEGDAVVIDLSKVTFAETDAYLACNSEIHRPVLVVHFTGGPDVRLHDPQTQRDFLVALATYHELCVSSARSAP